MFDSKKVEEKKKSSFVIKDVQNDPEQVVLIDTGEETSSPDARLRGNQTLCDTAPTQSDSANSPSGSVASANLKTTEVHPLPTNAARKQLNSNNISGDSLQQPPVLDSRYEVLDYLGTGGMGTVWKVRDLTLNETFAIKILRPELVLDDISLKRFRQEAALATELTHANIAAIFGPGEDLHGHPFIIMRYVEGESLASILAREGKLSPERADDIFRQIRDALIYSHSKGIVHRDIKPSNIIVSKTASGADLVQIVDFGIAKSIYEDVTKTQALTKTSDLFGSPLYMSPEQFLGQEVGPHSDFYSLGCVFYEMLAGCPPFNDGNPVKLVLQHLNDAPDLTKVPKKFRQILEGYLYKNPEYRKQLISGGLGDFPSGVGKTPGSDPLLLSIIVSMFCLATTLVAENAYSGFGASFVSVIFAFIPSIFLAVIAANLALERYKTAAPAKALVDFSRTALLCAIFSSLFAVFVLISRGVGLEWQIGVLLSPSVKPPLLVPSLPFLMFMLYSVPVWVSAPLVFYPILKRQLLGRLERAICSDTFKYCVVILLSGFLPSLCILSMLNITHLAHEYPLFIGVFTLQVFTGMIFAMVLAAVFILVAFFRKVPQDSQSKKKKVDVLLGFVPLALTLILSVPTSFYLQEFEAYGQMQREAGYFGYNTAKFQDAFSYPKTKSGNLGRLVALEGNSKNQAIEDRRKLCLQLIESSREDNWALERAYFALSMTYDAQTERSEWTSAIDNAIAAMKRASQSDSALMEMFCAPEMLSNWAIHNQIKWLVEHKEFDKAEGLLVAGREHWATLSELDRALYLTLYARCLSKN